MTSLLDPRHSAVLAIDLQNDNLAADGAAGGTVSAEHAHAVGTTARTAADLGYTPIVISDATASTTPEAHAADLKYGFADIAPTVDTETIISALSPTPTSNAPISSEAP
ncbi:isochorismatase family protein [Streptosporangium sp. NPDC001681]|uniref:isochorismatase family protein n=1 Tax=Streptosporangium sp. NPDC001681 TaxID=3154395 RepID=UPI00331B6FA3